MLGNEEINDEASLEFIKLDFFLFFLHLGCCFFNKIQLHLTEITLVLSDFRLFGLFLYIPVNNFQSCQGGFPGLKQYLAANKVSCSRTQHNDSAGGEARTSNPS